MLLGLAIAVLLALMLQLNALRVRRPAAFDLAGNGVIHLKAWIVVETGPARLVGEVLMLAGRAVRAVRARRLFQAGKVKRRRRYWTRGSIVSAAAQATRWAPQGRRAAWSTGPPPWQVPRAAGMAAAAA